MTETTAITVIPLETPTVGDRSYLVHNDYVTGGFALAQHAGAAYLVNAEDRVSFGRTLARDGEAVIQGE